MTRSRCCATTAFLWIAALAVFGAPARADLLLYEGFDYGAQGRDLAGLESAGNGWSGAWQEYGFSYSSQTQVDITAQYQPSGLTFGASGVELSVTGGSAQVSTSGNVYGNAGRPQDVAPTGTVFGSYLFRAASIGSVASLNAIPAISVVDNFSQFSSATKAFGNSNGGVTVAGGSPTQINAGDPISTTTTYLVIFRLTGLGEPTTAMTMWILTAPQFAELKDGGTITESELEDATHGSGVTQVLQEGTSSGSASLLDGYFINMFVYFGADAQYDEIRLSSSSIDEVTPLVGEASQAPEPGTLALLVATALLPASLAARRRRLRRGPG